MLHIESDDKYLNAQVILPHNGSHAEGTIKSRKRTSDGKFLIGKGNINPQLDSRIYNVEFPDGAVVEFAANEICEAIFDQMDDDGNTFSIFRGIIGYRKNDDAVKISDGYTFIGNVKKRVITTKGWDLRIEWSDGSASWLPLHVIKASNPIETAEFAVSRNIHNEPAFAWWVRSTLRNRDRVISRLKTTKVKKEYKFGVKVPSTVEDARSLDKDNGNSLWEDAINKELSKVRIAFQLIEDGENPLPGSKLINYHFIFDIKHDMSRKARLVAGGHLNKNVPSFVTYSSVVSKETVRTCFMLSSLNNLDILIGDIGNAYLNAQPREKCYVKITDPFLFGPSAVGRYAQIVRALYGMKSSGAAWRDMLAGVLHRELKFNNCLADHDLWFYPDINPTDNAKYYSYICIYVDDIMIVSHCPQKYMDMIKSHFLVKPDSIKTPDLYLGMSCKRTSDGIWLLSPNKYTRDFLKIAEKIVNDLGMKIPLKGNHPFSNVQYKPELDSSDFCNADQIQAYQQIVGMLRWMIELGRVDILFETTIMSSFMVSPRTGHLKQLIHIIAYIRKHDRSTLMMDPGTLDIHFKGNDEDHPDRKREIMRTIYRDAVEEIPPNAPEPRGKEVQMNVFCDSDHAGDRISRRSHTGILFFINMAPVAWFSKKQNTIESSTFGSEYVALRIAIEKIISLRYKLRMMGVPFSGSTNVFMDNQSVVKSALNPEATLKKKHVSIAYHKSRESFASGIIDIYWVPSNENLADLFTKSLPVEQRKNLFRSGIFY